MLLIDQVESASVLSPVATMIEAVAINVEYGNVRVLQHVDFSIAAGETIAILGPSGSGKSTLLHCLAGLHRPAAGHVQLHGCDLYAHDAEALAQVRRHHFGFVFQHHMLISDLPLIENVALPLLLDHQPRLPALQQAEVLLTQLGIEDLATRLPGAVSGGQAQRAAVARALIAKPAVVFADEPTGALDSETARVVLNTLLAGVQQRGVALVMVTHDPVVAAYCDRRVRLVDGVLVPEVP
jgi:putative ABC transport system ATP-binding protein